MERKKALRTALFLNLLSIVASLSRSDFPSSFIFGAATSSYQIEGAVKEGNRGLSNWDAFIHLSGSNIADGSNADLANDHYHLYMEDINLMKSLGITAYKFSISWARVLPKGRFGNVNSEGIKYYNNLIDALLLQGIQPFVTLYQFEIPQELEERYGSWLSPEIREDFGLFANVCFKAFGDKVKLWATLNEPNIVAVLSYQVGLHPPNHCSLPYRDCSSGNSSVEPYIAAHNMIISHAIATDIYRKNYQIKQGGEIGILVSSQWYEPMRDIEADHLAAQRAVVFESAWILDPIIYGDYPWEMRQLLGSRLPKFTMEEKDLLKNKLDFIGVNHYYSQYAMDCMLSPCQFGDMNWDAKIATSGYRHGVPIGAPTAMPVLFVVPQGYPQGGSEEVSLDTLHNDTERVEFMSSYLESISLAIRNGSDIKGYFTWSLMDSFEWTFGYGLKFGLFSVNRVTLERRPKLSSIWYKTFIAGQQLLLNRNDTFNLEM